ncbi:trypsin-like peptidase domain-containing protein [Streptomyces sp. NPDC054783]
MTEPPLAAARIDDGLSSGVPRVLEVPALASLYLQPLTPTGQVERGRAATGFVVRNSAARPFLVTNRHVVTGRDSKNNDKVKDGANVSAIRVLLHSAGSFGEWIALVLELGDEEERPLWLEHPEHGWKVDVVAIALPDFVEEKADLIAYRPGGPALARMDLTSELHVIGFPVGFDPFRTHAALGVWARGTIAWPPSLDWEDLPCTLIDCRARPGQSGSPVVFYADELARYRAADGELRSGPAWDLIGIYSGRTHDDSDIGIVWKRSAIEDIVERGRRPPAWRPGDEHTGRPRVTPLVDGVDAAGLAEPDFYVHSTAPA